MLCLYACSGLFVMSYLISAASLPSLVAPAVAMLRPAFSGAFCAGSASAAPPSPSIPSRPSTTGMPCGLRVGLCSRACGEAICAQRIRLHPCLHPCVCGVRARKVCVSVFV